MPARMVEDLAARAKQAHRAARAIVGRLRAGEPVSLDPQAAHIPGQEVRVEGTCPSQRWSEGMPASAPPDGDVACV